MCNTDIPDCVAGVGAGTNMICTWPTATVVSHGQVEKSLE